MATPLEHFETGSEADWHELERRLADFAKLARGDVPFAQVAAALVSHLDELLAPEAAAVWLLSDEGDPRLECELHLHALLDDGGAAAAHRRLLLDAARSGRLLHEPPSSGASRNATSYHLLTAPLVIDADAVGIVEILHRGTVSGDTLSGGQRVLSLLTELAADHVRRGEVRELRRQRRERRQFDEFLLRLHATLDPRVTCDELANEGRRHLACDRVAVALCRGHHCRVAAVSSVDVVNRRAPLVKRLERLIDLTVRTGEPFWYSADRQTVAPQLERALLEYLDEAHAATIGIVPLRGASVDDKQAPPIIGALVVEGFDARLRSHDPEPTLQLARHASLALTNALRFRRLPTLPFARRRVVRGEPSHWLAKSAVAAVVVGLLASTFIIQTDYNVYAQGELRPAVERHIYAPLDGYVQNVGATHGDRVAGGAVLLELASPTLDVEIQRVQGEHDATLQRSRAIDSVLLDRSSAQPLDPEQASQLAAEQEELRQLFASQREQLALLRQQRDSLVVTSPIVGEVLTWEAEQLLASRPVRQGQRLLTVADTDGAWQAELHVADDKVGGLIESLSAAGGASPARFELATQRGMWHDARLTSIAERTDLNADNQPIVRVIMEFDRAEFDELRTGATVFAKVHCGRRSVFDVWCRDLIDRVRGWLKF